MSVDPAPRDSDVSAPVRPPRPSAVEWAGLGLGLVLLVGGVALGGALPAHWGRIISVAGGVLMLWPAFRVRNRRLAATQAR